ncbi:TPA: hypothetical protein ACXDAY_002277 [Clostridium botulinum]|uniref:hypothetical protein n=1 Tax=Clostridium botulinum TaxID=1491 RepID=UPI000465A8FD|nr:hypothetical protein [Clostridium botulinum]APH21011.1 hypothetical protein NPD1_4097 [Clostridium botulinum]APQ71276.1 hypothetical protein RSJ8_4333 [Clostridium botulinum]APR02534.1 hypothetical protein RSJ2_4194 [Clostridium botulinum]AUN01435.1 hypothetical protein RSJ19_00190 [Clostridium botulinum]MBN3359162.1 hypothetical protein [Clostridium botulinum]
MEILSHNSDGKKDIKGIERCKKVYNSTISNKSYIKVNVLGKTWRVKKEAQNKWLKVAKVEDLIRDNLNDVLGALSVGITGVLIYFIMAMYY